jgi:hypothetical protein
VFLRYSPRRSLVSPVEGEVEVDVLRTKRPGDRTTLDGDESIG